MKNLRKLAVSLIAILGLAGCTVSGSSSKGSGSSASSADSSSVTSGESSSAPSSSSSSGSSSSSSSSSSEEQSISYTALGIMQDIGTAAWGYTEDGDFKEPDADGIVESNYTIGWEVESPVDSEECLNGVLTELCGILPDYLSVAMGPSYTAGAITSVDPALGVSELYTITDDQEFVAYFYNYCYNSSVSIVFMCGPYSAFAA